MPPLSRVLFRCSGRRKRKEIYGGLGGGPSGTLAAGHVIAEEVCEMSSARKHPIDNPLGGGGGGGGDGGGFSSW